MIKSIFYMLAPPKKQHLGGDSPSLSLSSSSSPAIRPPAARLPAPPSSGLPDEVGRLSLGQGLAQLCRALPRQAEPGNGGPGHGPVAWVLGGRRSDQGGHGFGQVCQGVYLK